VAAVARGGAIAATFPSMLTLKVRDETTSGDQLAALDLQLSSEQLTVRELIRARVHQEVRDHNAQTLVRRADATRRADPDKQTAVALDGFRRGHILLLVDDRQVEELDTVVTLHPGSSVTFLKLVPLVGG
jgi:hypothetical protein